MAKTAGLILEIRSPKRAFSTAFPQAGGGEEVGVDTDLFPCFFRLLEAVLILWLMVQHQSDFCFCHLISFSDPPLTSYKDPGSCDCIRSTWLIQGNFPISLIESPLKSPFCLLTYSEVWGISTWPWLVGHGDNNSAYLHCAVLSIKWIDIMNTWKSS